MNLSLDQMHKNSLQFRKRYRIANYLYYFFPRANPNANSKAVAPNSKNISLDVPLS